VFFKVANPLRDFVFGELEVLLCEAVHGIAGFVFHHYIDDDQLGADLKDGRAGWRRRSCLGRCLGEGRKGEKDA
jgi:hypothetical protein